MSAVVSVYRDAAGWLVAVQAACIIALVLLAAADYRHHLRQERRSAREADEAVTAVRSWRDDEDHIGAEIEQWLKDGEPGG